MPEKKYNFLLIEDEELLLKVIEQKLKSVGNDVTSFRTGAEAIKFLENTKTQPDVVWLDYYLPDMNGMEFMKKLDHEDKFDKLKIVVVSNSANDETVAKMLNMGVKAYIIKAEHRLEDIIKRMMEIIEN